MKKTIHFSLASYPGRPADYAMKMATENQPSDPMIGMLDLSHVQICPQNCIGQMTTELAEQMRDDYPDTQFRLHANVKVQEKHNALADLSRMPMFASYFHDIARVSETLKAPAYTIHAGNRKHGHTLTNLFGRLKRLEDKMGIPVGVEGLYPTNSEKLRFWLDCWDDYKLLLEHDVHYAIDLSHLNIVQCQSGVREDALVAELLSNERCIEVHVSANEGDSDSHNKFSFKEDATIWWEPLLVHANENAKFFYEGDLIRGTKIKRGHS